MAVMVVVRRRRLVMMVTVMMVMVSVMLRRRKMIPMVMVVMMISVLMVVMKMMMINVAEIYSERSNFMIPLKYQCSKTSGSRMSQCFFCGVRLGSVASQSPCARATIAKYHRRDGLNHRHLLLTVLETRRPRRKCLQSWFLQWPPFLASGQCGFT